MIGKRITQLREFSHRPFVRNVATVATGTAAAQAIGIAFAPLITRLYGPEAFGVQGVFASVVGLLSVVAALSYPTAIVLPRDDGDAIGLAKLSILIAGGTCCLTTIMLALFGAEILSLLGADTIVRFMYLIPVAMFTSVLSGALGQWLIRKKAFGVSARYVVIKTFFVSGTKTVIGFENPSGLGLILTNTFGNLLGTLLTYIGWRRHLKKKGILKATPPAETTTSLLTLARRNYDFPLLRTPQNLINALSQSLPMLLLAFYFGPSAAGQYSIAIAMLGIPSSLIGGSVMAVFYPRINEAIHNRENARSLIIRATVGMAITGALPFLGIIIFGPWLFEVIFGVDWRTAGEYSQWLSIWLFLQYVNKPAVSAIPALKMQGGLLIFEIFSTGSKFLALWVGFVTFESDTAAIAIFSMLGSISYIWLISWVIKKSGKTNYG
ncbi:lipopolysaccharide biosynthesis protein [Pseudogemmobacter sp. W21_MBD1_M6]|uniref:lipopolysaccharide biosynthesis protein n=1 Tax=Pseudogemmobacter sp. W21_MBD1_M6 TaxID=3240271 RepID=UPI003F996F06